MLPSSGHNAAAVVRDAEVAAGATVCTLGATAQVPSSHSSTLPVQPESTQSHRHTLVPAAPHRRRWSGATHTVSFISSLTVSRLSATNIQVHGHHNAAMPGCAYHQALYARLCLLPESWHVPELSTSHLQWESSPRHQSTEVSSGVGKRCWQAVTLSPSYEALGRPWSPWLLRCDCRCERVPAAKPATVFGKWQAEAATCMILSLASCLPTCIDRVALPAVVACVACVLLKVQKPCQLMCCSGRSDGTMT